MFLERLFIFTYVYACTSVGGGVTGGGGVFACEFGCLRMLPGAGVTGRCPDLGLGGGAELSLATAEHPPTTEPSF